VQVPALTITKSADTSTTLPGQTVEYTVTIADTGQTACSGATVTDTLALLDEATTMSNLLATASLRGRFGR